MKLIHHGGYNEQERDSYKEIIFSNTIQSMRYVPSSSPFVSHSIHTTTRPQVLSWTRCRTSTSNSLPKTMLGATSSSLCLARSRATSCRATLRMLSVVSGGTPA